MIGGNAAAAAAIGAATLGLLVAVYRMCRVPMVVVTLQFPASCMHTLQGFPARPITLACHGVLADHVPVAVPDRTVVCCMLACASPCEDSKRQPGSWG
jgi:hypothetical protein